MDIFAMDKAVLSCFKKFAVFKGRATRFEYWSFFLFEFLLGIISCIPFLQFVGWVLSIASIIPEISVSVRRLHDTGKSGWWWWFPLLGLIGYVPILFSGADDFGEILTYSLVWVVIGTILTLVLSIVLLVFYASPSQKGENKYGPEPVKAGEAQQQKTDTEELQKLKKLLDDGVITQEDYDQKKKELLGL